LISAAAKDLIREGKYDIITYREIDGKTRRTFFSSGKFSLSSRKPVRNENGRFVCKDKK